METAGDNSKKYSLWRKAGPEQSRRPDENHAVGQIFLEGSSLAEQGRKDKDEFSI
jgi:hypothetical protein